LRILVGSCQKGAKRATCRSLRVNPISASIRSSRSASRASSFRTQRFAKWLAPASLWSCRRPAAARHAFWGRAASKGVRLAVTTTTFGCAPLQCFSQAPHLDTREPLAPFGDARAPLRPYLRLRPAEGLLHRPPTP